jgi:thymidine phosphorylase
VLCLVQEHERVEAGQPLFELHADDQAHLELGLDAVRNAVTIGDVDIPPRGPLTLQTVRE